MRLIFGTLLFLSIISPYMNAEFSGPTKDKTVRVFGALISNYLASDQWTTLFNEIFDQDCYNGVSLSQQGNELIQRLLNVLTPSQKAQVAQMFINLSNQIGSDGLKNALNTLVDVIYNNLDSFYTQLLDAIQGYNATGMTQDGVLTNVYRDVNSFLTFQRFDTIVWRLHDRFNESTWSKIADNIRPYILISQYGFLFLLFVLLDIVSFVYGGLAIDLPGKQVLTVDQFKCLFNQGYTIFIGQIYSPDGAFNEIGIQNMRNAREAGLWVDAYASPCKNANNNCTNGLISGSDQAKAVIQRMNEEMLAFLFLDIERYNWPADQAGNRAFILDFTNTVKSASANGNFNSGIGIYTTYNDWSQIVGSSWNGVSDMDLYWVNWNGKQDLTTGFTPFGGWSAPCFHQYAGNVATNTCTSGVPVNYVYFGSCVCRDKICFNKLTKKRAMSFARRERKFDRRI